VDRYLGDRKYPTTSLDQRNHVLALAEVVLLGWPPVKDIRARAPRFEMGSRNSCGCERFSRYRSVGLRCHRNYLARSDEQAPHG
jgi:hypothetical protein